MNISIDIIIYFAIRIILLKGIHIDFLNICDLFWDVKTDNGVFGKIYKTLDTKQAHI